jgi:hypothetical protein
VVGLKSETSVGVRKEIECMINVIIICLRVRKCVSYLIRSDRIEKCAVCFVHDLCESYLSEK